jgi:hypothetical protein
MQFIVRGISQELADEVRRTRRAPGYGHPAHLELASGTGPCRCCLEPFVVGQEERLLLTYRPPGDAASLMAPGPVFIHARACRAHAGEGFPDGLRELPLAFEGRGAAGRVAAPVTGAAPPESQIARLFADDANEWLHLRHAEAGCFIARIERAAVFDLAATG